MSGQRTMGCTDAAEVMLAARHWPDAAAIGAFAAVTAGQIDLASLRLLDRWWRHCADRLSGEPPVERLRAFGGLAKLERLERALHAVAAADLPGLRDVKRRYRADRYQRCKHAEAAKPVERCLRFSVRRDALPTLWRRTLADMRAVTADSHFDVVSLDDRPAHAPSMIATTEKTLRQLAGSAGAIPDALSHDGVDLLMLDLAERNCKASTKAIRCKELLLFARWLGADAELIDYLRQLKNRFERLAGLQRKRKESWLLDSEVDLAAVIQRAQSLAVTAAYLPPQNDAALHKRLDSALLALSVNAPLRVADLHRLVIGRDISRAADGWRLMTTVQKQTQIYETGLLWPEITALLDSLLLDGRPSELIWQRLAERDQSPLFSLDDGRTCVALTWPSAVWRRHFGIGAHIVRSMWHQVCYLKGESTWIALALCGQVSARTAKHYQVKAGRRGAVCRGQALMRAIRDESEAELY